MNARLLRLWDALRASYWFVPTLMTLAAVAALQGVLVADRALVGRDIGLIGWLHGAGQPEGARTLLSTIAGSMITIAGVTFSILIVALALASSQFGPRLLRGFLRDRGNQVVLGTFIATFVYCLLVLRHVPMEAGTTQVPQLAVTLALLLGLAGVAVLIYFVHHAASSIQASHVIEVAGIELDGAIRQLYPARDEAGTWSTAAREDALPEGFEDRARTVTALASGHVQEIDTAGLVALAAANDLVIELLHSRGSFVVEGRPLGRLLAGVDGAGPAAGSDDDDADEPDAGDPGPGGGEDRDVLDTETLDRKVNDALVLAPGRASTRDVERGVSQLAEIAVRALSPGINDPFTATQAVRRLGQSLALLGDRKLPTPTLHDDDGALRLVVPVPTVSDLLHLAFDQVRHYGRADPHVPLELLDIMASVGVRALHPGLRAAVLEHAEAVHRVSADALIEAADRDRLEAAFETARAVLRGDERPGEG